jgi:hypothetical protein
MADVGGIRIDEGLADILSKLRQSESSKAKSSKSSAVATALADKASDSSDKSLVDRFSSQVKVNTSSLIHTFTNQDYKSLESAGFTEEDVLPWLSYSDRDTENVHYINSKFELVSTKISKTPNDAAALKMSKDFLCECDYFKSRHFVLHVRQLDSDYSYSRSFIAANESARNNIIVEDTQVIDEAENQPTLKKVATENLAGDVVDSYKYFHFVVFTDLGIADFVANSEDISYPYAYNSNKELDEWFENVSNTVIMQNARFDSNKQYELSDEVNNIRDYNYSMISMRRPGVFTLDSDSNQDSNYKLTIKLKDEFSFIPTNSIISCLKRYSISTKKSIDDFKRFLNRYFEVLI